MPVSLQTPLISYTANGSVTSFAYPFRIIYSSDLKVYVDGTQVTSGFAVTGVDNPVGGSVDFTVAPSNGSIIRLQRSVPLERTTDYVEGGQLAAVTMDNDFDRLVMMLQDNNIAPLLEAPDATWDAANKRIKNVATPIAGNDAVTKDYVDTTIPSNVASAAASAASANTSATEAAASSVSASTSATNAANSESTTAALLTAANLPTPIVGAAGKMIRINAGETGYEFQTAAQVLTNIGAASSGHNHTGVYEAANANIAKTNVAQNFTAPQRSEPINDNDLSFNLAGAGNNYVCTFSTSGTLTFTNIGTNSGKSGWIKFVVTGTPTVSAATNSKISAANLTKLGTAGTYIASYYCDGVDVYVSIGTYA